ncbi:MAG TPA: hypothetical protein VJ867_17455 [Gemmatimonadaceae bacterium]|nr:hypothetical protein [Gemmatimonadaceae bacterium]
MLGRTLLALSACAAAAVAQVPGAPVLQNAWANPGLAVAANFGGGSGQSFYGLAGAMGFGGGKMQLSAAAGANNANGSTRGAYGARAAMSVWSSSGGALGVGAFAGLGGAPRTRSNNVVNNAAILNVPVGATVGYRRSLGSRGFSAYASPFYRWARSDNGTVASTGSMRVSLGADFAVTSSIGVTVGGELGGSSGRAGSKSSGLFGAAVSFVPGGR